jgi:hypothetical protein
MPWSLESISKRPDNGRGKAAWVGFVAVITLTGCSALESPASRDYTPRPPSTPTPAALRIVVLGDSIAGGSNEGGNGANGWPAIVAQELGLVLINRAEGGTGYTSASQPGTEPYTARVDEIVSLKPDIVMWTFSACCTANCLWPRFW